ncbi:MAG TPA: hypothetical protein VF037_03150 [Gemmatimonadales bacterium]
MQRGRERVLAMLLAAGALACGPDRLARVEEEAAGRVEAMRERLNEARTEGRMDMPIARWELPGGLDEVSGLAVTPDGRLFAHGDETAELYEIDYHRGIVVKRFSLGPEEVDGDFEALAIRDSTFLLLTSRGRIYEFTEGRNGERVRYSTSEPPLGRDCREFEGMAFDGEDLVFACKQARKAFGDALLLFRWRPGTRAVEHIVVPMDSVRARVPAWEGFGAADMTRRADTGTWLLVAGPEVGYLEVSPDGAVLGARALPGGHTQPEGIAWTPEGFLLIADEAGGGPAAITIYPGALQ